MSGSPIRKVLRFYELLLAFRHAGSDLQYRQSIDNKMIWGNTFPCEGGDCLVALVNHAVLTRIWQWIQFEIGIVFVEIYPCTTYSDVHERTYQHDVVSGCWCGGSQHTWMEAFIHRCPGIILTPDGNDRALHLGKCLLG